MAQIQPSKKRGEKSPVQGMNGALPADAFRGNFDLSIKNI